MRSKRKTKDRVVSFALMFVMVVSLITGFSVTEVKAEGEVIVSSDGSIANSNTSRNVAVGQDGTIYVCWHSASGVFVAKSTDNGKSFSEGVKVADGNYECEVTVSSIGRVYMAYIKSSAVHVAYSDDKGATFTDVTAVSDFYGGFTVHIATDGSHVYVVGNQGTTLVKSDDGGVTYKTVTISSTGMAFSDIFVDAQTHMITVVEDAPEVIYYTSTDYGETFSEAYIPTVAGSQAMVYYSVGTGGKTNGTTYAYMAGGYFDGGNQFLYRFNLSTNEETIKVDVEDCSTDMGRSITADNKGNVAVGFTSSDGAVSFQVSHDGGETFGDSVAVANSDSSNACINPVTGELMFLYVNESGAISLKTYAGKLTGYAITTDPASLSFYKEEGAVGKKVSILCNGEDTEITGITATGDFTVSYEGELPTLKNGESFPITVQYKNTADAALTGSVEITYGTGSKVTLPVTVYENVGGVEYKYGINIDSANGDVALYADDVLLEAPQSYKNKTIKLVATPKTGYNFTGWTVVSGDITLSSASEATTTFTMPEGAVSIKADYELAGTAGAEDKKKVEDAQKEAEEVLAALTPDNNETENDIIEAVKNALKDAGLEDVEIAIENFKKTEATTENPGSVTGTVKITSGKECVEVPFEKAIAKLDTPKDPDSGNVIGGVEGKEDSTFKISIIMGNEVVKSIDKVDNNEAFTFEGMEDGFYNLVIEETTASNEKKVVTKIVEVVNGKVTNVGTVAVGDNQTAVEVDQEAPQVVADGLEQLYTAVPKEVTDAGINVPQIIADGGTAKVILAVVKAKATDVLNSMKKEAESKKKEVGVVFDAEVDMKITPVSGEEQVIKISDTESLIHMVMPLSEKDQGKTGYQVLRSHLEKGQTEETISVLPELTGAEKTSPAKEGFFIENGYVHIWAQKFSTYAVIYDEVVTVPVEDNDSNEEDSNEEDSQTTANASVKTGDATPLTALFTMLILSGAGICALGMKSRRKEETEE